MVYFILHCDRIKLEEVRLQWPPMTAYRPYSLYYLFFFKQIGCHKKAISVQPGAKFEKMSSGVAQPSKHFKHALALAGVHLHQLWPGVLVIIKSQLYDIPQAPTWRPQCSAVY
jgi:hypothetical protein